MIYYESMKKQDYHKSLRLLGLALIVVLAAGTAWSSSTTIEIQRIFERRYDKTWLGATDEEREEFLELYREWQRREERKERIEERKEDREERNFKRSLRQRERALEQRKRARERRERQYKRQKRLERRAMKIKMRNMKKKMERSHRNR